MNSYRLFLFLSTMLFLQPNRADAQEGKFIWAKKTKGDAISLDSSGNICVAGGHQPSCITKYDKDGNILWEKPFGNGNITVTGMSVTIGDSQNIYIKGSFEGKASFGTQAFSSSARAGFFAKFDPHGNLQWIQQNSGYIGDIMSDVLNNVYITGSFEGTVEFGERKLLGVGDQDIFIAKYDPSGKLLWARATGEESRDSAFAIVIDSLGKIYITGSYYWRNYFFARYDENGDLIWVNNKDINPSGDDEGNDIAIDKLGHIYVTGSNVTAFLIKYDSAGKPIWKWTTGTPYRPFISGADDNNGDAVAVDSLSNAYVTGSFTGSILGFPSKGGRDAFIVKLNPNGEMIWAQQVGGVGSDGGSSIAVDASGNVYTAGWFWNSITIGDSTLSNTDEHSNYSHYLVKLR